MIVPEKISHAEILRAIENPKEPLLESVALFDLFTNEELGRGTEVARIYVDISRPESHTDE